MTRLPRTGNLGQFDTAAGATRIPDRNRTIGRKRRVERIGKLRFVGGSENHHVRNGAQIGEIEDTVMRRAVLAHKTRTVEAEYDMQILKRDVHDQLVECSLHERGVDGDDRQHPAERETRGHPHRMTFSDPHIVEALRVGLGEAIQARAGGHRRRYGDDAFVERRLGDEGAREGLGEADRRGCRRPHLTGLDAEGSDAVKRVGGLLGVAIA